MDDGTNQSINQSINFSSFYTYVTSNIHHSMRFRYQQSIAQATMSDHTSQSSLSRRVSLLPFNHKLVCIGSFLILASLSCSFLLETRDLNKLWKGEDIRYYHHPPETSSLKYTSSSKIEEDDENQRNEFKETTLLSSSRPDVPFAHHPSRPHVAWLMSFPNSGTSYTMRLVGHMSNSTVATNYGPECTYASKKLSLQHNLNNNNATAIQSLYPGSVSEGGSPNGPYLLYPEHGVPPPSSYILTKTHCGGRCNDCGPGTYIETRESFFDMCLRASRPREQEDTLTLPASSFFRKHGDKYVYVKYDPKLVSRAIHLIRNPFDNIVSNFHLEHHAKIRTNTTASRHWLEKYSNDVKGFRAWCRDLDSKYAKEEKRSRLIPTYIQDLFESVPCHKAFYLFAQVSHLFLVRTNCSCSTYRPCTL